MPATSARNLLSCFSRLIPLMYWNSRAKPLVMATVKPLPFTSVDAQSPSQPKCTLYKCTDSGLHGPPLLVLNMR